MVRQSRLPASEGSIDAANCFNRISYAIGSVIFQAVGVPKREVESMLTGLKICVTFCALPMETLSCLQGAIFIKYQARCQVNKAAGVQWAVMSIVTSKSQKKKGYGAHFLCPIFVLCAHILSFSLTIPTSCTSTAWRRRWLG